MKSFIATLTTTLLTAGIAFAQCAKPEDNLFTCTFDDGVFAIELCVVDAGSLPKVSYSYGKTGEKPELFMEAEFQPLSDKDGYYLSRRDVDTTILDISAGELFYTLGTTTVNGESGGSLDVAQLSSEDPQLFKICDQSSITGKFDPIWQKLEEKGWHYSHSDDAELWVNKTEVK